MAQRDLDGPPLEPGDLTGDDPSISETPRAGIEEANTSPETTVDTHEGKVGDESSKISFLGSVVGLCRYCAGIVPVLCREYVGIVSVLRRGLCRIAPAYCSPPSVRCSCKLLLLISLGCSFTWNPSMSAHLRVPVPLLSRTIPWLP